MKSRCWMAACPNGPRNADRSGTARGLRHRRGRSCRISGRAQLRGIGDILRNVLSRQELVLDARAAGRFTGAVPEPRAGMRSGHIPGSANVPYTDLLNADGTFRPAGEVRARLEAAGVDGKKPVVTSCGSGVTACILTLGLRIAGFPEGAVYDGSWTEWGGRADTPIEVG